MILSQVRNAVLAKGYKWFEDAADKGYDVNIVGIRNSSPGKVVTNLFDDTITISYRDVYGNSMSGRILQSQVRKEYNSIIMLME